MAETPEQTIERVYLLMREPGVTYDPSVLESLKDALRRAVGDERRACADIAYAAAQGPSTDNIVEAPASAKVRKEIARAIGRAIALRDDRR
jgi:hypothetical protein